MSEKTTKVIELPVIPKEVAEAIEASRELDLSYIEKMARRNVGCFVTIFDWLSRNDDNYDKYFTAVIHGYTIEKSPEEKVREYYMILGKWANEHHADADHESEMMCISEMSGVAKTLNLLGITIEGVND